jgi:glycosyltransferase involved in cell wall biosynthesis
MHASGKLTIAQANFHMLWGGQAEVVLSLGKSLAGLGHALIVVAPPGSELAKRSNEAGLETFTGCRFRKGFRPMTFFKDLRALGAMLRDRGVDICHCHGSQDHWTGAIARGRFSPATQIVRTRHNIYPVKNHIANRWLFQKKTAQVITIFGAQSRYFTETGLLRADQLFTLHSPLPQEFVNPGPVARVVRQELQLPDDVPLIGFAASFHPDKAPLDFVAAAERVARQFPRAHFAMAGYGPLSDAARAAARAAGLEPRFHLLSFRKDILQVMASFDLFMLTSVTREASSTVVKQAGALGIPVVATDVGGTCEVLADGVTGILVPPNDPESLARAAISILGDPARAAAMGAAGREKVLREFTAQAIARRTEGLYLSLLRACKTIT